MRFFSGLGFLGIALFIIGIIVVNIFIGGWAVQYTVEFWASYFKGVAVHVHFLPCAIAGLFLGEIAIPAAIVTWILSFVL